jgi:hypothetical protein
MPQHGNLLALKTVCLKNQIDIDEAFMKTKLTFWHYLVMGIIAFGFIDAAVMFYLATMY